MKNVNTLDFPFSRLVPDGCQNELKLSDVSQVAPELANQDTKIVSIYGLLFIFY